MFVVAAWIVVRAYGPTTPPAEPVGLVIILPLVAFNGVFWP